MEAQLSSDAERTDLLLRPALHRELVDRLSDMIVDGTLPSGTRLNERELCERFGVSRTPMREAVLLLAKEGLVEIIPRRGSRVATISPEQTHDILELLGGIEALAGELACERATKQQVAAIVQRHREMVAFFKANDMLSYFKTNEAIHDLIVSASGNQQISNLHRTMRVRVLSAMYLPNARKERWQAAIREHESFIEALQVRDGKRLAALLREHKSHTWDELRYHLRRDSSKSPQQARPDAA